MIMELLIYTAKLSAYWIALYGLYALFLHRQTFLRWNRAYLIGSLVLSFALPLVQYPEAAPPLPVVYQVSAASFTVIAEATSPSLLTWENLLWLLYGAGVLVMLVRLAGKFRHLFSFLQKGDGIPMEGYTLVLLDNNAAGSFSFMKWVFISPADYAQNFDTILTHELVHVQQRHSWDILLVEILHVVFWFNPVLLLYKNALQEVHEYLADQQVALAQAVTDHRDRYAEFLISYTLGTPTNVLTNQFFNAKLLKSRITMLYKNKNSKWSLGKYAAVALLIGFASLMVASCEREVMPSAANGEQMVKGNINVTGIINTPDHKPLMGATITDSQGKKGAITDEAGRFSLKVPAGTDLKVSAPGLGAMDLKVNPKYKNADYDITMSSKGGVPSSMVFSPSADKQSVKVTVQTGEVNGETIFTVVEKSPEYPGGIQEMFKFLGENIKYPEAAVKANVSGKVFVNFVITTEGEIKDITILKGLGFGADAEAVRVVSKMPRWEPGMQDGKPVNVRYNLPIMFQLDDDKEIKANDSDKKVGLVESGTFNGPSTEGVTMTYTGVGQARVVIDGVMQKEGYDIKKVGPENVEKVNVLKGESATKAYGEKGANGVIEVFMKKK
jgi:TonB family protein